MEGFSKETLKEIHPIFNFPQLNIFSIENVITKVDNKVKTKRYFFLLSNAGVFLLKGKRFRQSVSLVESISFFDLTAIKICMNELYLYSTTTSFNISAPNAYIIGQQICHIRNTLFPPELISFSFEYNLSSAPPNFSVDSLVFKTDTIFLDRTLSCYLHYLNQKPIDYSTVCQFNLSDYIDHEIIYITDDNSKNPIFQSILDALSFDTVINILVFKSINLQDIILNSNLVYKYNKSIQKIVYQKVVFETKGNSDIFSLLHLPHLFHPIKFKFSECLFVDIQFFNNLSIIETHVDSISFDRCTFRSEIDQIFGTFNQNQTFRSLRKISIDSLNIPFSIEKLFNYHHLRNSVEKLVLSQMNTDSSDIIQYAFSVKSNLKSLAIINNEFLNSIKIQSVESPIMLNLTLQSQTTRYSSLYSLFQCITQPNIIITRLNLSDLKISKNDFDNFIQNLSMFQLPYLKSFVFDDNPMTSEQLKIFSKFISHQKKLILLSVNRSINKLKGNEGAIYFLNMIKESTIKHLFIEGDITNDKFNIGKELNSFLHDILFDNKLTSLDISYQDLGEEGVDFLIELIHTTSIENLWFDEINVPDLSSMLHLCNEILNSKLKYAKWPSKELNMLVYQDEVKNEMIVHSIHDPANNTMIAVKISNSPSLDNLKNCKIRTNIAPEFVKLKNSFRSKFGKISSVKTLSEIKDTDEDIYEIDFQLSYFKDVDFTVQNEIADIYNECFDIGKNDPAIRSAISSPIVHSLFNYESQISMHEIDNYLS